MNFKVYNIEQIQHYREDKKHVVISIESPHYDDDVKLPENKNRLDILRLKFHDFTNTDREYIESLKKSALAKRIVFFSMEDADKIVSFIKKYANDIEMIIIHCEAGISRSAGVAAALSKCINGDDEIFFKRYLPNSLVYSSIIKKWEGDIV